MGRNGIELNSAYDRLCEVAKVMRDQTKTDDGRLFCNAVRAQRQRYRSQRHMVKKRAPKIVGTVSAAAALAAAAAADDDDFDDNIDFEAMDTDDPPLFKRRTNQTQRPRSPDSLQPGPSQPSVMASIAPEDYELTTDEMLISRLEYELGSAKDEMDELQIINAGLREKNADLQRDLTRALVNQTTSRTLVDTQAELEDTIAQQSLELEQLKEFTRELQYTNSRLKSSIRVREHETNALRAQLLLSLDGRIPGDGQVADPGEMSRLQIQLQELQKSNETLQLSRDELQRGQSGPRLQRNQPRAQHKEALANEVEESEVHDIRPIKSLLLDVSELKEDFAHDLIALKAYEGIEGELRQQLSNLSAPSTPRLDSPRLNGKKHSFDEFTEVSGDSETITSEPAAKRGKLPVDIC